MAEFLKLSDSDKVKHMEQFPDNPRGWRKATDDKGTCSQCGKKNVGAGDFCFGCHKLICADCIEKEPHNSACYTKDLTAK
ncbi:MAG: hypothetical protein WC378_20995 [Opitutaceae bacterium]